MRLIREECALRDNAGKLPEKKARIKALTEEHAGLVKQMPQPVSEEEAKLQIDLQEKRQALTAAQQAAAADKQKLQKIADLRTRVAAFKAQMAHFYSEIEAALNEAGIPEADRATFRPAFPGETGLALTRRETELKRALAERQGAQDNPAEGTTV